MWKLSTSKARSYQVTARRVFPYNSINLRYDNRPYPYHLLSRKNQDMCDHEKWRWNWRIFRLVRIMGKTVSFVDIECSVIDQFRYIIQYLASRLRGIKLTNWRNHLKNYECVIEFFSFIPAGLVTKYDFQHIETWSSTQKLVNKCKFK